jgi:hypothetical protein
VTDESDRAHALRYRLGESRISVTLDAPVAEHLDYDDRGVAKWSGEAYIEVYADPDHPDPAEAAFWAPADVALSRRPISGAPEGSETLVVATASGLVIDPYTARDLATVLDETADYAHFFDLFVDTGEYGVHEDLDDRLDGLGSQVIVLDRAQLAPAWRGLGGVGRLLTARMLQWLIGDALVVVAQPAPFELSPDDDEARYAAGREQVRGVWGSLGFQLWRNDIWYLDPGKNDLNDAVARLEDRLGLRRR